MLMRPLMPPEVSQGKAAEKVAREAVVAVTEEVAAVVTAEVERELIVVLVETALRDKIAQNARSADLRVEKSERTEVVIAQELPDLLEKMVVRVILDSKEKVRE